MFLENSAYQELSNQQFASLASLCDEFDEQLQRGEDPVLEDFLVKVSGLDRGVAFAELLAIEIDFRYANGEQPSPADYETRFAQDQDTIVSVFSDVQTSSESPDSVSASSSNIPTEIGAYELFGNLVEAEWGSSTKLTTNRWTAKLP